MATSKPRREESGIVRAVFNTPWALEDSKMRQITAFISKWEAGEPVDRESFAPMRILYDAVEPVEGRSYSIGHGVAVIPVHGIISQRANMLSWWSGGVSTELLKRDIAEVLANPSVQQVVLDVDSPGGNVDDITNVSDFIFHARGQKPMVAVANSTMTSGAYWIASSADRVVMGSETAVAGSIGVVAVHRDYSQVESKRGVKTTEITAGKYKRITSPYQPLSAEGEQVLQNQVDYIYAIFVDHVARNRGVSVEKVISQMADAKLFMGRQAVEAGLADDMEPLSAILQTLSRNGDKAVYAIGKGGQIMDSKEKKSVERTDSQAPVTVDHVREQHPEIYKAIFDAGREEGRKGSFDAAYEQGAEDERNRIQGIEDVAIEGFEEIVSAYKFDGVTKPEQVATQILKAQKAKGGFSVADLASDASQVEGAPDGSGSEAHDIEQGANLISQNFR